MIMKKWIGAGLLAVLLITAAGAAPGGTAHAAGTGIGVEPGQSMPDFTVSLTDGTTATLSETLKEKDLVVLNVFTSWCGPCEKEFPELEKVYGERKDRMEIISVSCDPEDTMQVITDYRNEHNLTFPMGVAGSSLDFLTITSIPTTIFIDRSGKVGLVKVGAFTTEGEFGEKVSYFLSADYAGKALETEKALNLLPYMLGMVGIGIILRIIGRWGIFRKAGRKGWHSLVPFLSVYEEYSIVWNGWIGVFATLCIPLSCIAAMAKMPSIVNQALAGIPLLVSIPEGFRLAKAFGKGRIFGVLLFIPFLKEIGRVILGVDGSGYQIEKK